VGSEMSPIVEQVLEDLVRRARQRGFVMAAEAQQELEDAEAPADAFDQVVDALREMSFEVREESTESFIVAVNSTSEIEVSDPVRMYLHEIGRVPLLDAQQEVELSMQMETGRRAGEKLAAEKDLPGHEQAILQRACRDGDKAQRRLVEANLRLVVSIAKKYVGRGMPLLDLVQEGNLRATWA